MDRLQRFRGHFYNWYDTRDLRPLDPQYVSSVDSGNLAGHLIALANACREWRGASDGGRPRWSPASRTPCSSRANRCGRSPTIGGRRPPPGSSSPMRSMRSPPRCARPSRRRRSVRDWRELAPHAATMADIAAHARRANAATTPAPRCSTGRRRRIASIESHRARRRARPPSRPAPCDRRLAALATAARAMADAMEFGFLLDPERRLLSIGYRVARRHARPELLRPARLRGAARELRRDRQGRRPVAALVPPRPRRHPDRTRRGADLLVGIDVRVPDAVAGDARAGGQPARADQPPGRAAADGLRRRRSACPGAISESAYNARDLELTYQYSNFGVPGPRAEARPRRERRRRALRDGARGHGRSAGGGAQLRPPRRHRRARPLRLLRGARLHAHAPARGKGRRRRPRLHGAPPGHDGGRDRQRPARRGDARAVPRRADRPGDGAAAAGTHAARRRGGSPQGGGSRRPRRRSATSSCRRCDGSAPRTPPRRRRTCSRTAGTR